MSEERRFYEPVVLHVLKDKDPAIIAQTTDLIEKIWQNGRYVAICNSDDYRFTLIKFKNEEDAKNFKNIIIKISEALGDLPLADYESYSPFFLGEQRQLIKTMLRYYDGAEVVAWKGKVREKTLEKINDLFK